MYNDFSGFPLEVSFLGNQWWVTTPGESLEPLKDYFGDGIGFNYLCEAGGTVGALALARMLGKVLEEPECDIEKAMSQRLKSLKRMGVSIDVEDEPLRLECQVFSNEGTHREGKYSVWCHLADDFGDMLFDIDNLSSESEAEEWASNYFDFLSSICVDFSVIYNNKV